MTKAQSTPLPKSAKKLFLETSLYTTYRYAATEWRTVKEIENFRGPLDSMCVECGQDSVFTGAFERLRKVAPRYGPSSDSDDESQFTSAARVFDVEFTCSRNRDHRLIFIFRLHDYSLTKIGQFPSFADLHKNRLKDYKSVLAGERIDELNKAAGLFSHGIGAGSFVYLRRVFEHLIESAHQDEMQNGGWDEELYGRSRMEEKIKLLEHALPQFLVENKAMYGILSRGIHELSEEECLAYFEPLREAVDLILEERLQKQAKDRRVAAARNAIARIAGEVKS